MESFIIMSTWPPGKITHIWNNAQFFDFYQTQIQSLPGLPCPSVTKSVRLLRLYWCDPGVWRFKQPLQKPCNLPLPNQLLFALTPMLLTLEQKKSHIVDARTKQKPWCQKSDPIIFFCHFWLIFQSLSKLLLWTKGVERVKVLYALGRLCLWQCS